MKKITVLATALAVVMSLTFSACSSKEKHQTAEDLQNAQDKVVSSVDSMAADVKESANEASDNMKESVAETKEDIAMERKKLAESLDNQRLKAKYELDKIDASIKNASADEKEKLRIRREKIKEDMKSLDNDISDVKNNVKSDWKQFKHDLNQKIDKVQKDIEN
jgi:hypothetical protein